jgi:hypothetical protein
MFENNTSDSKPIHHHSEWNLIQMDMVQMRTIIPTVVAGTTTEVAIHMVGEEVGRATQANPETITDHPTRPLLRHPHHQGLQRRRQIMQLNMPSITALVLTPMQHMVDTRTTSRTISIMLNSRRSNRAKHPLHQVVKAPHRHLLGQEVHRRHRREVQAMAQCRLHQVCERTIVLYELALVTRCTSRSFYIFHLPSW